MILTQEQILDAIYSSGKDQKDFAAMIVKIADALEDSFYEEPPSPHQQVTIGKLRKLADEVGQFYDSI